MPEAIVNAFKLAPVIGPWFGLAALIATLLKAWTPYRKMSVERQSNEVARLFARVEKLEEDLAATGRRLEEQREAFESKIAYERAVHDAEMTVMRHRANNIAGCFDMLCELIENRPDNASSIVTRIRDRRAKQEADEAAEKSAVSSARIVAARC